MIRSFSRSEREEAVTASPLLPAGLDQHLLAVSSMVFTLSVRIRETQSSVAHYTKCIIQDSCQVRYTRYSARLGSSEFQVRVLLAS